MLKILPKILSGISLNFHLLCSSVFLLCQQHFFGTFGPVNTLHYKSECSVRECRSKDLDFECSFAVSTDCSIREY